MSKITGLCKLCLEEKKLCKSHIFPKGMYGFCEQELTVRSFFSDKPRRLAKKRNNGVFEHLLCEVCEKTIGKYEDYSLDLLNMAKIDLESSHVVSYESFDFRRFRLFLLSLFWRSAISEQVEYSNISLSDLYLEKIRLVLHDPLLFDWSPRFFPIKVYFSEHKNMDVRGMHIPPCSLRSDEGNNYIYSFINGWSLLFYPEMCSKGTAVEQVFYDDLDTNSLKIYKFTGKDDAFFLGATDLFLNSIIDDFKN